MKWKILLGGLLAGAVGTASYYGYYAYQERMAPTQITLQWEALIPEAERNLPPPQVDHENPDPMSVPQPVGGVVAALNGQRVKIPGFAVPIEGDAKQVTAFLLVPYFGACTHVPPPPTNQIIYVRYPQGAKVQELWDAIWVEGVLSTESSRHELGNTSYALTATRVSMYDSRTGDTGLGASPVQGDD
ncbi:MAG: DUF3299 domain-containing protein [Aeromonas sp.]